MVAAGLLALLVACTPDADEEVNSLPPAQEEPAATSAGISVAVIVPSLDGMDSSMQAALKQDVDAIADWVEDGVDDVRAVPAETAVFVADFAELVAERGTDLVCILGDGALPVIERLAPRYSAVTFCSVRPAQPAEADGGEEPAGLPGTVQVRIEELGHLIGMSARVAAGAAPVGLVLGGDGLLDDQLRAGIEAGAGGGPVITAEGSDRSMADQVTELANMGTQAVVIDGGVGAGDAVHAAVDADIGVLTPVPVWEESLFERGAVLTWWVRWDVVLRAPILTLLEDDAANDAPLGVDSGIFAVHPGDLASDSLRSLLEVATEDLASGARDPLASPIPADVSDDEDPPDTPEGPADPAGDDPEGGRGDAALTGDGGQDIPADRDGTTDLD